MPLKRITLLLLPLFSLSFAQKTLSITIDDAPNTRLFAQDGYRSILMEKLDSLDIPVALFFNENKLYHGDSIVRNFALFQQWIARDYVTAGNHSFSHAR